MRLRSIGSTRAPTRWAERQEPGRSPSWAATIPPTATISILTGSGPDWVFGNGGNDTLGAAGGANTIVGGFGTDSILTGIANDLIFANEFNDTVVAGDGGNTVFGGLGNDTILGGAGRDSLLGNEDNDTIRAGAGIDTITGGAGNDVFAYTAAIDDAPAELITDVNFDQDRFQVVTAVTFAADVGAMTGADLTAAASAAIASAFTQAANANVAAAFTYGGHTYLAINQDGTRNAFVDSGDLLVDITGAAGTIGAADFIV